MNFPRTALATRSAPGAIDDGIRGSSRRHSGSAAPVRLPTERGVRPLVGPLVAPEAIPRVTSRPNRDHQPEEGGGEEAGQAKDRAQDDHVHEAPRSIRLLIVAGGSRRSSVRGSGVVIIAPMHDRCPP